MLPVKLWIIECWWWWLHTGREMREKFLILFEQRINHTRHLAC
jgi:hypothetical protein